MLQVVLGDHRHCSIIVLYVCGAISSATRVFTSEVAVLAVAAKVLFWKYAQPGGANYISFSAACGLCDGKVDMFNQFDF